MAKLNENKLGGIMLILATVVLLITIFFEYQTGWIGVERPDNEVPLFMYKNWADLELIWGWQIYSHVFFAIGYLMLMKYSTPFMRLIWSAILVGSIMSIIGYGITLGGYYPALEVIDTHPALFKAVRGSVAVLYLTGMTGMLLYIIPFSLESFTANGTIHKTFGLIILAVIIISILIGMFTSIPVKVTGVTWFFMPLILGISYLKKPVPERF